jgi:transposase
LRPKHSIYGTQFKRQVLSHQDQEKLSSRQVATIHDIRNPNQVVVWRRNFDQGRCEAPSNKVAAETAQNLRDENERLRADVAYLKKLQALIRSK